MKKYVAVGGMCLLLLASVYGLISGPDHVDVGVPEEYHIELAGPEPIITEWETGVYQQRWCAAIHLVPLSTVTETTGWEPCEDVWERDWTMNFNQVGGHVLLTRMVQTTQVWDMELAQWNVTQENEVIANEAIAIVAVQPPSEPIDLPPPPTPDGEFE